MDIDKFNLKLEIVDDIIVKDNISFEKIAFVNLLINSKIILNNDFFKDSFLYFKELENSLIKNGVFLIFTCACGIADDGGWEGILVSHLEQSIIWDFSINNINYHFRFEERQYREEILRLKCEISQLPFGITLEPNVVVYPENWAVVL